METLTLAIASTLAPQTPAADTVVMLVTPSGLETAASISMIVIGAFFLLLLPVLGILFLQIKKLNGTVRDLGQQALRRADPLLESGKSIADNLEFVSVAVRTDVERLTASVRAIAEGLKEASDRMEERVAEFNALMEVVQSEAEDIFVGTASTVRGVRAGARSLVRGRVETTDAEDEELRRLHGPEDDAGSAYAVGLRESDSPDAFR